jgi:hypothetical protein
MSEEPMPDDWWPDSDYVPYLEAEQRLYAWVLTRVAGVPWEEAMTRAVARFHYQSIEDRGVMTNMGAWRVAMIDLFGHHRHDPEEFGVAQEYEAERMRLFHGE